MIIDSSGSGSHSNKTDNDGRSDSLSSKSDASVQRNSPPMSTVTTANLSVAGESSISGAGGAPMLLSSSSGSGSGKDVGVGGSPKMSVGNNTSGSSMLSSSVLSSTAGRQAVSGRSGRGAGVVRRPKTHAVVITGPPGAGKSSLVLAHQARWRGK